MILQSFSLDDGTSVDLRKETPEDLNAVWMLFSGLSNESRSTLPPFNRKLIERWSNSLGEVTFKPVLACIDGRVIGRATLRHEVSPATKHRAEFGIVVHDDFQGKGVGTNLTLFHVYLARSRGLRKICLDVFSDNVRAVHVFESCGFVKEGLLVDHYWFNGRYYDVVRMGLML